MPGCPRIVITYCSQYHFGNDLDEVALVPGGGGVFMIDYDGARLWDRVADGGLPDAKALKQRVRDKLDPGRDLGHIDRTRAPPEEG